MQTKNIRSIRQRLLRWYQQHQRPLPWRQTSDPYQIWVSEVMLQQTQVKTVLSYYRPFLEHFPDIDTLAAATEQSVLKAWEGLGYYARARNLHRAARQLVEAGTAKVPNDWKRLRALPGIGDYIAAAVLSIAFGQPYAVVDGNVKRVLARLQCLEARVNDSTVHRVYQQQAAQLLDKKAPGSYNQALMELGATVCTPRRPQCEHCPLSAVCRAYQHGLVAQYPMRKARPKVPEHHIAVGVIAKEGLWLITRRSSQGLLGGLWEFPGGRVKPGESPMDACLREIREEVNLAVTVERHLVRVRHAYTHFKIVMDVFCCRYRSGKVKLNGPVDYRWIAPEEMDAYPFPRANHKFIPLLRTQKACGS